MARKHKRPVGGSWRMDETYIKVKGVGKYLYRAVDKQGKTVDFLLTAKRDMASAKRFFDKAIEANGDPDRGAMDESGANKAAIDAINAGRDVPILLRQVKYLNNIVEQDHRAIKRVDRADAQLQIISSSRFRARRRRTHAHDPQGPVHDRRRGYDVVPRPILCAGSTGLSSLRHPSSFPGKFRPLEKPQLYEVTTRILQGGKAVDEVMLHTGLRDVRFDPAQGVFLNGKHVKLQGVSIHQDHAGVGVAVPDAIWEYRLRRLKELGANAIRFTHGATGPELLDMADRMGFLIMDENRNFNISPDYMSQLEWLVRRDRHHPSVIMWSMFNEEPMQSTEAGYEMARNMTAAVKALDDTRPVTAAMNGGFFGEYSVGKALDVVGANYQVDVYDKFHEVFPNVPFTSSEDTSAFMTRGVYKTDNSKNVFASYDDDFATWGNSHRDGWEAIAKRPHVAGGFVWTGFDYRGEPTPNAWPSVSSVFGIMDLNGFAKTAYYIHQVQWIKDKPLVHIAPH